MNVRLYWSLLLLCAAWVLSGCNDGSGSSEPSLSADHSPYSELTLRLAERMSDLGSNGASGAFLYPAEPEQANHSGNLRFQVEASLSAGIEQLYIAIDQPEADQAFALCDSSCGNSADVAGWASGLSPYSLGFNQPGSHDFLLLVDDGEQTTEVDRLTLEWAPEFITIDHAAREADSLSVEWSSDHTYPRYNLYVADGYQRTPSSGQWNRLNLEESLSATAEGLPDDDMAPVTFWVTGVDATGEAGRSRLYTWPLGLTADFDSVLYYYTDDLPAELTGQIFSDDVALSAALSLGEDITVPLDVTEDNGGWAIALDGVSDLPGGTWTLTVTAESAEEWQPDATLTSTLVIETPVPAWTLDPLQVNENNLSLTVTGTWDPSADDASTFDSVLVEIEEPGQPGTLRTTAEATVGESGFTSIIFDENGTWTLTQGEWPALFSDELEIYPDLVTATLTTEVGTQVTATNDAWVKTTPPNENTVTLDIDPIGGDGYLNASDVGENIPVTGSVSGDARVGDDVVVEVYGDAFTTALDEALQFSVEIPFSTLEMDSQVYVIVTATDQVGNSGEVSETATYTVDTTIPDPPTLTLEYDTGSEPGLTSNGSVLVGGVGINNSWAYSLDSGATWSDGAGDGFVLPEGDYGNDVVLARQMDPAGNISDTGALGPVTVDSSSPVANYNNYSLIWSGSDAISVSLENGLLTNDEDPFDLGLSVYDAATITPDVGNGTLTIEPDGAFHYLPDEGDSGLEFTYRAEAANGEYSEVATVAVELRLSGQVGPQICTVLPAQIPAQTSSSWDLDPMNRLQGDFSASLSLASPLPDPNLGLSLSGTTAQFNNPAPGIYTDIYLEAVNQFGETDELGPFAVEAVESYADGQIAAVDQQDLQIQRAASDAGGRHLLIGHNPAENMGRELRIFAFGADGALDQAFGTAGEFALMLPDSGVLNEAEGQVVVQLAQDYQNGWIIGGHVRYDDGVDEHLAAFMLLLTESGELDTRFESGAATPGLYFHEDAEEPMEIGAISVDAPDRFFVARNVVEFSDGVVVPDSFAVWDVDPDDAFDNGSLLFDKSVYDDFQAFSGLRVRVIQPVPGVDGNLMLIAQSRNTASNDQLLIGRNLRNSNWALDTDFATAGVLNPLQGTSSEFPTVDYFTTTEDGRLWFAGQSRDNNDEADVYLASIYLNYPDGPDSGYSVTDSYFGGTKRFTLGLTPGLLNEVDWYVASEATVPRVYRRVYTGGTELQDDDPVSGLPDDLDYLSSIQVVPGAGLSALFSYNDPSSDDIVRLKQRLETQTDYQPLNMAQPEQCGVISRSQQVADGLNLSAKDVLSGDNDLFVTLGGGGDWRIARLLDGTRWFRGDDRDGFFRHYEGSPAMVAINVLAQEADGTLLVAGTEPSDYAGQIGRVLASGELDTGYAGGNTFHTTNASPNALARVDGDRLYYAYYDSFSEESRLGLLDDSGVLTDGFTGGELAFPEQDIQHLVAGENGRVYVLMSNSEVVRVDTDGTTASWTPPDSSQNIFDGLLSADGHLILVTAESNGHGPLRITSVLLDNGDPSGLNTAFGDDGVVEIAELGIGVPPASGPMNAITQDQDGNIYVVASDYSASAYIAKISNDGSFDESWGNFGLTPIGYPMVESGVRSITHHDGQLRVLWGDTVSAAVTRLDQDGFQDMSNGPATRYFGNVEGDQAQSLSTTPGGRTYLLNRTRLNEVDPASIFWGLDRAGSNLQDFGNPDDPDVDLGAVVVLDDQEEALNLTPNRLVSGSVGQLWLAGAEWLAGLPDREWTVAGYYLGDLTADGGTMDTQRLDRELLGSSNLTFDDAEVASLSQVVNGRILLAGTAYPEIGNPRPLVSALDTRGEMTVLDFEGNTDLVWEPDANQFYYGQVHEMVSAYETGQGTVFILLNEVDSDFWALGRYEPGGIDTDYGNSGWVRHAEFESNRAVDHVVNAQGGTLVLYQDETGSGVQWNDAEGDLVDSWFGPGIEAEALMLDPFGHVFVGGSTEEDLPVVIKLNSLLEQTHRWEGAVLSRAGSARVMDFGLDPGGHLNVLLDAYQDGNWAARMAQIPFASYGR